MERTAVFGRALAIVSLSVLIGVIGKASRATGLGGNLDKIHPRSPQTMNSHTPRPETLVTNMSISKEGRRTIRDIRDPNFIHKDAAWEHDNTTNAPNFTDYFIHYFIHIPKAGGTYARTILQKDSRKSTTWPPHAPGTNIVCDRGTQAVEMWKRFDRTHRQENCAMYMTESHYYGIPRHVYAIIRDPRKHVLSQYFHCTESKAHKSRAHFMPGLGEWLDAWVDIKEAGEKLDALLEAGRNESQVRVQVRNNTVRIVTNHKELENLAKQFYCYNPIDMQSTLLGFAFDDITKDALVERYAVVGVGSKMDTSLCLVSIRWSGTVPRRCNCTGNQEPVSKTTSVLHTVKNDKFSHNVTHHGGTYRATETELAAIDRLTRRDRILYEHALELFEEEAMKVEAEYSITLCDSYLPILV